MPTKKVETKKIEKTSVKKSIVKKADTKTVKKAVDKAKITVSVKDITGKAAGTVTLPIEIFGVKINKSLMAQAVRVYLANQRQGSAHTKTRGEITGTTKKVWRQKGTGRARHGSAKGPIFVGGGITFGPQTRDFTLEMPKKMKKAALFSALSAKAAGKEIVVLDEKGIKEKTKEFHTTLGALDLLNKKKKGHSVLLLTGSEAKTIRRIAKNIKGLQIDSVKDMNTYEVLNARHVIFLKSSLDEVAKLTGEKK